MTKQRQLTAISDDTMRQTLPTAREYCVVTLRHGPNQHQPGVEKIIWEHARRNFALRADGLLSIVCPVSDGSDFSGIGVFNASLDETRQIMDEDPAVKAGALIYEAHVCRSFPGDSLPK